MGKPVPLWQADLAMNFRCGLLEEEFHQKKNFGRQKWEIKMK